MIEKEKFEEILKKHNLGDKDIVDLQDLYDTAVADFRTNSSALVLSNYIGALKDIIVERVDSGVSEMAKNLLFKLKTIQRNFQTPKKQEKTKSLEPDSCPYCHRRGDEAQEAIIDEPDLTVQVEVDTPIGLRRNDGGFMSILYGPKKISQLHIYYCPMCGRKLNEPKD